MCVTQCLSEGSSVGLMSGIRGRKGWKGGSQNGVLWGCWGARRAQGGACSIPAEVWSCHPHGHPLDTQKSDSLIGCHGAPRGSPEMELGKGYVMNLEPWTRQLSTCHPGSLPGAVDDGQGPLWARNVCTCSSSGLTPRLHRCPQD